MNALKSSAPSGEHKNIAVQIAVERRHTVGSDFRVKLEAHASDY
jgi:hypothetical protein